MISIPVTEKETGCRLDRIVRKRLPLMPLAGVYALIRKGGVLVSGRRVRQDYRLLQGDLIAIDADSTELAVTDRKESEYPSKLATTEYFRRNFRILHEDHDLLACNKPAGLVVHPGTGHLRRDTLIDLAAAYLLTGREIRENDDIALVHRLDRDTSGVILIAKNKPALRRIHEVFRTRMLIKEYVAICHHRPPANEGEIAVRLVRGRDARGETTMRVYEQGPAGVFSRSEYRVSAYHHDLSEVEVSLDTGRTHQIRIHLAHVGAPIVGDTRYGDAALDTGLFSRKRGAVRRLYLHSRKLVVPGMKGGKALIIKAPLPEEFRSIMAEDEIGR